LFQKRRMFADSFLSVYIGITKGKKVDHKSGNIFDIAKDKNLDHKSWEK